MFIKNLIIGLLSFYAFDLSRLKKSTLLLHFNETQIERTIENKKRKEKKQEKSYDNRKWRASKKYVNQHFKTKGSHPKDHRYSNQKRLRRMYRNT